MSVEVITITPLTWLIWQHHQLTKASKQLAVRKVKSKLDWRRSHFQIFMSPSFSHTLLLKCEFCVKFSSMVHVSSDETHNCQDNYTLINFIKNSKTSQTQENREEKVDHFTNSCFEAWFALFSVRGVTLPCSTNCLTVYIFALA